MARQNASKIRIAIIVLSVLLIVVAGGLASRLVYLHYFYKPESTVAVPDNLIGNESIDSSDVSNGGDNDAPLNSSSTEDNSGNSNEDVSISDTIGSNDAAQSSEANTPSIEISAPHKASTLELFNTQLTDNESFHVENMFPGDTVTKYFCVKVYHDQSVTLFFKTDITEQTKLLGGVLHIKVTHLGSGKVLCDAPFDEINGKEFDEILNANAENTSECFYRVDISLDTSVGNEYQESMLKADFSWYVKDDGGMITPPQTGDNSNILLWTLLASGSLLMIILLLWKRRKEDSHEEF